jgi:D-amino peptidase
MKIYISVDMEGVSCILRREQTRKGTPEYEEARYLLVKEANAAIEGALEAGADEIILFDAHSTGFNFPLEEIHPEAKLAQGASASSRHPFLDESVDMMFLLAHHAMAGTQAAVMEHTYSLGVGRMAVNGIDMGEIGIEALRAGYFNVPIGLVTGDDKACAEAIKLLGEVETAVVKHGFARHASLNLAPKKAREVVKQAAYNAVKRAGSFKPYKLAPPYEVELDYLTPDIADDTYVNGLDKIRVGAKKIIHKNVNILDLFVTMP